MRRPRGDDYSASLKICDLTQFYSPLSGGVKRYLHEKIAYISNCSSGDTHVLIVPGSKTEVTTNARSRVYSIRSPLVSRSSRYRALLNLRAIEEILERERPDLIESSDPYQIGWKAIAIGRALRVPVVGFYHSHFPEAYLRGSTKFLGKRGTQRAMKLTRAYVHRLYNRFQATLVPSETLGDLLSEWGVRNVRPVRLGVNTGIFRPLPDDGAATRESLGVGRGRTLLLYAGRLTKEKNTQTLLRAFELLRQRDQNKFHLVVIGDGPQRNKVQKLQRRGGNISWISYCADSVDLARYYRAADLFVHPGVQETFGLVALESQACGTPVVGIRGSYMDRIICHDQKSWAQENNPDALADAIEDFSAKKLSTLGKTAAGAAEKLHSWPRVFEELFCIYREVRANYRRL
ncbi:MAG: glycosyltransferase family 1 protein [Verrucomicrobia bacterium]|nr:MAG: glycosyltransferase family 1 protein [Verrucomicrobiota bacterium]